MLVEALNLLIETAQKAAGANQAARVLELPADPYRFAIVKADGTIEFHAKPNRERRHDLGRLSEVSNFVEFATDTLGGKPTVWLNETGVMVRVNDNATEQRNDTALLKFRRTKTHDRLRKIGEQWMTQKEFVRLLRIDLADAATDSTRELLKVARVMSTKSSTTGHGTIEHGRQSLGRDIEEEVLSNVGNLPEEVTFNVRLFDDPGLTRRHAIRCAVDIDPRALTFNLTPIGEAFEDAVDEELESIEAILDGECDCPVFIGTP